jgi:hypothetical protein
VRRERLQRNNREVEVETRALSTTDGAGGDFVPPLWMINDYVALARTARPTADRVRNENLPTGTDQINVPKILTGTAVAEQATQNTAVQNTDATTGSVAANVATLAGQQVLPVQLIEQSPINMDSILLAGPGVRLRREGRPVRAEQQRDEQEGPPAGDRHQRGHLHQRLAHRGAAVQKIADAIQQVTSNRFLPPDTIVMHPRRWAYLSRRWTRPGARSFIDSAQARRSTRWRTSTPVSPGPTASSVASRVST